MNDVCGFWEVPGFWPMILVLALFAAASALCIAYGPDENPDQNDDSEDQL